MLEYVKGCAECQRNKVNNRPTRAPLVPIPPKINALPFETVALDFITKLPLSGGYDAILTVTDHDCTKAVVFIPCNEEITAEGTAELYVKHVFLWYGLPSQVISNQDPRFMSKFMREVCKILGIAQNISTTYHPQTDGQSERTNQWLEQYLQFWTNEHQDNWAPLLPLAKFAHNNWTHEGTRESPFWVMMGYNPHADWIDRPLPIPQVTLQIDQFQEAQKCAQELMVKAQQSWVKHKDTPRYKVGDQVWLEGKHLRTHQSMAKLAAWHHGPFPIVEVLSPVNYHLQLPTQWSVHPVFHMDLLTPYHKTTMHGINYQHPPPDLVEGEEEYEVERIVDSRHHGRRRTLQYLIKWKGYPDSDNEWVNHRDMHAPEAIREYKAHQIKRGVTSVESPSPSFPVLMILPTTSNAILNVTDQAVLDAQTAAADLAHEGSLITEQELRNLIQLFPGATLATLTPDVDGLENVPEFLRLPPGAKIGYDANA